jgi:hypothetical protein
VPSAAPGTREISENFSENTAAILDNFSDIRPMSDFWDHWLEAVRFTCEAQSVISARMMMLAAATPDAAVEETARMVTEKFLAFAKAGLAADKALQDGLGFYEAAERAYAPLADCVHANAGRLGRAA